MPRPLLIIIAALLTALTAHANEDCGLRVLHAPMQGLPTLVQTAPPAKLGDRQRFYTHIPDGEIEAELELLSDHAAFWVETRYANIPPPARLRALANEFDRVIYPRVRSWFGSEWLPGVDGDSRVHILLHDIEGNESAAGFGGYVAPVNFYPQLPNSNAREMIALDVFALRDYGAVRLNALVAHEFNHLTNWRQRGGRIDERWLEEGRATFAEWAVYKRFHTNYFGNYLGDPTRSLTSDNSFETVYGASFLLLMYLHDNFGGRAFDEALARTPERGFAAIERALEETGETRRFEEIFQLWAFANLVNDSDAHPLAAYSNLDRRRRIERTKIDRRASHPSAGFLHNGDTLREWSPAYVELAQLPAGPFTARVVGSVSPRFQASFWRPSSGEYGAVPRNAQGEAVFSIPNAAAGESVFLILSTSVEQRLSISSRLENAGEGLVPPTFPPRVSPDESAPFARGWLSSPFAQSPSLRAVGSLPLGGEARAAAFNQNDLWIGYRWGMARHQRDGSNAPPLTAVYPTDGHVNDILADESLIVAAVGSAGVALFDAESGKRLGRAHNGGSAVRLARYGDWLWALNENVGARVYDISDPAAPRRVRNLLTGAGLDLHIENDRLYLCDRKDGMVIYNIENAPEMERIGAAPLAFRGTVPIGSRVWGGSGAFVSVNTRDPNNMEVETALLMTGAVLDAVLAGENLIALAEREAGARLVDVSNPFQPRSLSRVQTRGEALRAEVDGQQLLIADGNGGVSLINISDPAAPTLTAQIDSSGRGEAARARNGFIYAAAGSRGALIFDANGADGLIGAVQTRASAAAAAAEAHEGTLYIATGAGLEYADIRDPRRPRYLGVQRISEPAADLLVSPDGAAVYAAADDLYAYAASPDGLHPTRRVPIDGRAAALAFNRGYLYAGALNGGVSVIDESMRVVRRLAEASPAQAVDVSQERLYVGVGDEIAVYDIADPPNPRLLNRWTAGFSVRALDARGGYVFAGGEQTAAGWDATDALNPTQTALERGFEWVGGIALTQDKLVVSDQDRLYVYLRSDGGALSVQEPETPYNPQIEPALETAAGANFPNPFNPETWLPFTLAEPGDVQVEIYDAKGRLVRRLSAGPLPAGRYETRERAIRWDGKNERGQPVAGGLYFYKFSAPGYQIIRRMTARP
ncbi:MAG: hypothetical protein OXT69_01035 [Candidatus Poribacteria bacterium]|nr:hypothetical protein [Candidatus Poribacteria bacterium]